MCLLDSRLSTQQAKRMYTRASKGLAMLGLILKQHDTSIQETGRLEGNPAKQCVHMELYCFL